MRSGFIPGFPNELDSEAGLTSYSGFVYRSPNEGIWEEQPSRKAHNSGFRNGKGHAQAWAELHVYFGRFTIGDCIFGIVGGLVFLQVLPVPSPMVTDNQDQNNRSAGLH